MGNRELTVAQVEEVVREVSVFDERKDPGHGKNRCTTLCTLHI